MLPAKIVNKATQLTRGSVTHLQNVINQCVPIVLLAIANQRQLDEYFCAAIVSTVTSHRQHFHSAHSSLWCLSLPDFAQQIPFAHQDVTFPLIYVISSKLLLDDTELMPNL